MASLIEHYAVDLASTTAPTSPAPYLVIGKRRLSISGTFVATVTLQRLDHAGNWQTLPATFTAPYEGYIDQGRDPSYYRAKLSAFTSGTAHIEIG